MEALSVLSVLSTCLDNLREQIELPFLVYEASNKLMLESQAVYC